MVLPQEERPKRCGAFLPSTTSRSTAWTSPPKMRKQTKLVGGNNVVERRTNIWQEMTISVRGQWIKIWHSNQQQKQGQGRRNSMLSSPTADEAEEESEIFHHDFIKKQHHQSPSQPQSDYHSVHDDDEQSNQSSMKIFESDISEESESGWSEWEDQTASESTEEDIDGLFAAHDNMVHYHPRQQQQTQGSTRSIPTTIQMEKPEQDDNIRLISSADGMATSRTINATAKEETKQQQSSTPEPKGNEVSKHSISKLNLSRQQRKRRSSEAPIDSECNDSDMDLCGVRDSLHGSFGSEATGIPSPLKKKKKGLQSLPTTTSFHWNEDPTKSQADWVVEIYNEAGRGEGGPSSGAVDVYNIHQSIVSNGTRRSRWFAKEFRRRQSGQHRQSEDCTIHDTKTSCNISRLSLSGEQAKIFPAILDFMYYGTEATIAFTAEQACAAFKVAEIFEVRAMKRAILRFYRKNISFKNMGKFLNCAKKYNADDLIDVTKVRIGKLILDQPKKASLLQPKFLAEIIRLTREKTVEEYLRDSEAVLGDDSPKLAETQSKRFSIAAYVCASRHKSNTTNDLPDEVFGFLFGAEILPFIDASVADGIIVMEGGRRLKEQAESVHTNSLQRRCVGGIVHGWETFEKQYSSPDAASVALQRLPSNILAEILIYKLKHK